VGARASFRCLAEPGLVGGGSLPGFELPSVAVVVRAEGGAQRLAELLRQAPVPVLARVHDDELLLDVRTLLDEDEIELEAAMKRALSVDSD